MVDTLTLSTAEKALFETKEDALTWAVSTTGTNGEVGSSGMTTNNGVIVTAQAAAEAFYVTVGTGSFVVKASDDNAPITGLKIAWLKV